MHVLLQATPADPTGLPGGYVWSLLRALLALGLVLSLAWLILRWLARRGVGTGLRGSGATRLAVLQRLPLDTRRSLYLIQADRRSLLIGVGDGQAPRLVYDLGEAPAEVPAAPDPSSRRPAGESSDGPAG